MKLVVTHCSGSTCKTTLSKHMFAPLMNGRRIEVEDINSGDGQADASLESKHFNALAAELNVLSDEDNVVLDIGASTFRKVILDKMSELRTTREEIDWWVVPCTPSAKVVLDTITTVQSLIKIGVKPDRIIIIKSQVTEIDPSSMEKTFALVDAMEQLGIFIAPEAVLTSEVYDELKGDQRNVIDMDNNYPDFKAMKRAAAGNEVAMVNVGRAILLQNQAENAAKNLRAVYSSLPLASTTLAA